MCLFNKGLTKETHCWRHGESEAALMHMFCTCIVVQPFWIEVINYINVIFEQQLRLVDMHILLNYLPTEWKLLECQ